MATGLVGNVFGRVLHDERGTEDFFIVSICRLRDARSA